MPFVGVLRAFLADLVAKFFGIKMKNYGNSCREIFLYLKPLFRHDYRLWTHRNQPVAKSFTIIQRRQ